MRKPGSDRDRPSPTPAPAGGTAGPDSPSTAPAHPATAAPWAGAAGGSVQIEHAFDDNHFATQLFGLYGRNLSRIEKKLAIKVDSRGNHVTLEGRRAACEQGLEVLTRLYAMVESGRELVQGDVDGVIREVLSQGSLFDFDPSAQRQSFEEIQLRRRSVRARTPAQDAYIRALKRHTLVFGMGPAGTGKTWLAVAYAVHLLERRMVDRIVLTRPAVEAGERLGFLPGDMKDKVDPYLRPIYDALYDLMDRAFVERAMLGGEIEIAPLAFMRGRTLSNAAVILDEAQNATSMQMKMFLTRLGENSHMIITGDPSQTDLPGAQKSGLAEAVKLLEGLEGISVSRFRAEDVVRHELVARIVAAYDRLDAARMAGQPDATAWHSAQMPTQATAAPAIPTPPATGEEA